MVFLLEREQQKLGYHVSSKLDIQNPDRRGDVVYILPEPMVGIGRQGFITVIASAVTTAPPLGSGTAGTVAGALAGAVLGGALGLIPGSGTAVAGERCGVL